MTKIESAKKKRETLWSAIWILPIMALAITLWLGWRVYDSRGVIIQIEFESGSGIQVNKTSLMYKGIAIGKVTDLQVDEQSRKVVATVEVDQKAAPYLGKKSVFWLVSPKVSLAGVTGLETIVSGVYISVMPVDGPPSNFFKASLKAPSLLDNVAGLHLVLKADKLGSLDQGSPIYYRQVQVGQVNDYQLASDQKTINIRILIDEPYRHLVHKNTRFWNTSGITFTGGLSGFKLHADSLVSIASGGIAFDTPNNGEDIPVDTSIPFKLYDDFDAAQSGIKVMLKLQEFAGLSEGKTPVMYQGVSVGFVKKVRIDSDYTEASAELSLDPRVEGLLNEGTEFWVVKPTISLTGISGLDTIFRGNYIEVKFSKKGKPTREFTIRPKAPPLNMDAPGLHLVLFADQLGSIDVGSPILYRQLKVGSVQSYQLGKSGQRVVLGIHIDKEYEQLVNTSTRFWNVSGVTLKGGLNGIEIKSESLQTLVTGGIAFDTPNPKASPIKKKVEAFLLYPGEEEAHQNGTLITLRMNDTQGVEVGAPIKIRGVKIGTVESIALNDYLSGVDIRARITDDNSRIARSDSLFWVVKPELGLLRTANLGTLITGAYIGALPGSEKARKQTVFNLLSQAPDDGQKGDGLRLVLSAPRKGSLKEGLPITYREIPVGKVVSFALSPQADTVLVTVVIDAKYVPLVHAGSRFWVTSGINIDAGLFKGVKVRTESMETILEGGIAFATPEGKEMGAVAKPNAVFILHAEPEQQWLTWSPKIQLKQ